MVHDLAILHPVQSHPYMNLPVKHLVTVNWLRKGRKVYPPFQWRTDVG